MNERVRWVTKAEAAEELEVSLSTLDRKIRTGEVEIRREGRRVYVRMVGEYINDEELLRRAIIREDELARTVRELERSASDWEQERARLERDRDAARESETAAIRAHRELEKAYGKELADEAVGLQARPGRCHAARGRRRSRVVVCAEVEEALSVCHPGLWPHLRRT